MILICKLKTVNLQNLLFFFFSQKEDDPLNISRRCKIKQAVTFTPWNYMETREKEGTIKPNPKKNVMDLLSTTIGAVMCLATNSNCPQQNLKWAFSYLDLIKDEYGQSPPNVQGILNHIQQVARGIKSYLNKSGEEQANVAIPAEEEPPAETEEVPPTEESPEEEPEPE